MTERIVVAVWLAMLSSSISCSGHGDNAPSKCTSSDVDCLLAAMVVTSGGSPVTLQSVDASRLTPTEVTAGPPTIWSTLTSGIDAWDGVSWTLEDTSGDLVYDVWSASPSDVWAVGASQRIKHWDGTAWTTSSVGANGALSYAAVWGSSASDVYAGGTGGALVRWNGASWSAVDAGATADINAIAGSGPDDVWVGGVSGSLRRWHGGVWTPYTLDSSINIIAFWVGSASEAWAIASNDVALHWDGANWTQVAPPGATYLYGVWGSAATDVWMIGYEITQGTFLLHWDGLSWTTKPNPPGMSEFASIWGRGASDIWLGGNGKMAHWNGSAWTVIAASPGLHPTIDGVTASATAGSPPSITNQLVPAVFHSAGGTVDVTVDWTDPSGCTPAFCMQLCNSNLRCSTHARCSGLNRDGKLAGSTILTLGYRVDTPPDSTTLNIVPVSSADCSDPLAHLGDAQVMVGGTSTVSQTWTTDVAPTNYDGTWNLEVAITTCYAFTHTVPITISGGTFSGHLFQYCARAVDGATRLGNNDCGADLTQDVSASLTVTGHDIDGNLTIHGGGCDGTNGFSGAFDSTTSGDAGSFFGTLTFTR